MQTLAEHKGFKTFCGIYADAVISNRPLVISAPSDLRVIFHLLTEKIENVSK